MTTINGVNVGLSGSTGTGSFVGSTSPSITTPDLGTPSAIVLTNATGLVAGGVAANSGAGIPVQVKSTTITGTVTTSSNTYADVTGLTVSITPGATTSKILIMAHISVGPGTANNMFVQLVRDSTAICIGDAASTRKRATAASPLVGSASGLLTISFNFVDAPATTSSTTYKIQFANSDNSTAVYVNRSTGDSDSSAVGRATSTITVMEIK